MTFFILSFIFFVFVLVKSNSKKTNIGLGDKFVVEKKKCPPHEWYWQEIVDQYGERQGDRMVCKVCGPLSKMLNGSAE